MAKNPYEVLGLKRGASQEEIKTAYRALVKKYHPDRYQNNPLADLAEEKLREVNEAYDELMRNASSYDKTYGRGERQGYANGYAQGYDGMNGRAYGTSSEYIEIRSAINMGNLAKAEQLLIKAPNRDAEWYFLSGVLSYRKGYIDDALMNVRQAMDMAPDNYEFRTVYQRMTQGGGMYASGSNVRGYNSNFCADCITCYCLSSLCSPCW